MKLTILAMRFKTKTLKICLVVLCLLCSSCTLGSPQFNGATFYMKEIKLTRGQVAIVDDEDFEWLNQWKWHTQKGRHTFYAARHDWKNGEYVAYVYMHRAILGLRSKNIHADHIDHNGLNNQRSNLRKCTNRQNRFNMVHRIGGTSKYRGVDFFNVAKLWRARINKDKKVYDLGYFKLEVEAAKEYNKKAIELYGEFANLNTV